jgi:hypothetical protein
MATGAVIEEVAVNLEEAAAATRGLDSRFVGGLFGGICIGAALGFYFGHRWNKEKIRAEAFKKSEEEVAKIREFYQDTAKVVPEKPTLEDVVEERGYSLKVEESEQPRPTRPPVPVQEPPTQPVVVPVEEPVVLPSRDFTPSGVAKRHVEREKDKNEGWDYELELQRRTSTEPYIIHQDEYAQNEPEHGQVAYTYYAVDGVLTDEGEEKIRRPEQYVGLANLGNFGHGADDYHVLYVRNERLELDFEICLLAASYEETVQGLSSDEDKT